MIVNDQKNIKVHFAGCEVIPQFKCLLALLDPPKYSLYTAFPFVERKTFKKTKSPLITADQEIKRIPNYIEENSRHVIQDSGLFTLMFGSGSNEMTLPIMDAWYENLIEHTLETRFAGTVVEVDCQKLFGIEKAWEYRRKLKRELRNRQINVFHLEDGAKGLDELIEFSDYLAVSVPELRRFGLKTNYLAKIANYIKNKKPSIDIHLLGCTETKILKELNFCSSSDSTSWKSGVRYGYISGKHINTIKKDELHRIVDRDRFAEALRWQEKSGAGVVVNAYYCLLSYEKYAGSQN